MQKMIKSLQIIAAIFFAILITACASSTKPLPPPMKLKAERYGHAVVNDGEKIYVLNGTRSGENVTTKEYTGDIEIIDPRTRTTDLIEDVLIPRRYGSAIHDGDRSIYIFGGVSLQNRGRLEFESRVEIFDTVMKKVRFAKSMPQPARFVTSIFKDNKIYVLGGQKSDGIVSMTRVASYYDLEKEKWFKLPDLPHGMQTKAVLRNNGIYLVGGFARTTKYATFYKLDLKTNEWEIFPRLPKETSANAVTMSAKNNYELYSFGDYDDLGRVMKFDFMSEKWSKVKVNFKPVRHAAVTTLGGVIYVIGGTTATETGGKNYVQEFRL